ncbi:DUF3078 domain-containing protein [Gramella sp. AN32]|uniref:DUF3078 domain-containing protein n=1 Tax=Christiangramia antarctica TaxID=2058158 RepID=A0ABW5WYI4_9FLAO|nr:DUF3078 domain-containing protein [Gramella sp. AN32]MCM4155171.1 hypothetical protein [Gramella sp. AN32]
MRKALLLMCAILVGNFAFAQEETSKDSIPPNGWHKEGTLQLLLNQSAFNKEWIGGGTSSIAGNLTFNYDFNYRKDDFTWDNRVLANYGLTKLKENDYARKTSDRFELNSIAGKQIQETNFYYSWFLNFRTQFAKGYEFSEDPDTGETIRTETTHIFSPAYLQTGPGIMWKKNDDFMVNLAPATARLIIVDKDFTSGADYNDGDYFGVDSGESTRFEFGASLTAQAGFDLWENVKMENSLNLYSNYLENPGNVDIDYLMNLNMGINKYLSANLLFQAIYDDNAVAAFQIREVFGLGINVEL